MGPRCKGPRGSSRSPWAVLDWLWLNGPGAERGLEPAFVLHTSTTGMGRGRRDALQVFDAVPGSVRNGVWRRYHCAHVQGHGHGANDEGRGKKLGQGKVLGVG